MEYALPIQTKNTTKSIHFAQLSVLLQNEYYILVCLKIYFNFIIIIINIIASTTAAAAAAAAATTIIIIIIIRFQT
jgi:hypothetical protein